MPDVLTTDESTALARCELVIERGLVAFLEVAEAMLEIRDDRLYRVSHGTFETYCQERWGWGSNYVNRQIAAAEVTSVIRQHTGNGSAVPIGTGQVDVPLPSNEAVARELAPLRDDPDALTDAWIDAVHANGDHPTAAQTRAAVQNQQPDPDPLSNADDQVRPSRIGETMEPDPLPVEPFSEIAPQDTEDAVREMVGSWERIRNVINIAAQEEIELLLMHDEFLLDRHREMLTSAHMRLVDAVPDPPLSPN